MKRILKIIKDEGAEISYGPDAKKVISSLKLTKKKNRFFQEMKRKLKKYMRETK
jgi:hypothetical protein